MAEVKLKGNGIHTNGKLPTKGQKAPEIHGVDTDLKEKTLADFKGKKKIICFVPSLDTPVCSLSAQKFSDAVKKHPGTVVLYISMDTPFALKRVCIAENGMGQIIPQKSTDTRDENLFLRLYFHHLGISFIDQRVFSIS